ncbi:hypothetical protein Lepto7375DRAFT_6729 [Leptolyngbya sp. PCC 7375]|nr:hypothetical protein Lepto7375DRAFT_6729 [Leptolyngbya sp. PCC 7375]
MSILISHKVKQGYQVSAEVLLPGPKQPVTEIPQRLVEFVYGENGITFTNNAPIQLELSQDSRHWEGMVRLDDQGFLVMTDKFPETILGFVAMPPVEA